MVTHRPNGPLLANTHNDNLCTHSSAAAEAAAAAGTTRMDEVSVATEPPLGQAFIYEKSTLTTRGIACVLHKWTPEKPAQIRGAAVVYHGFGAHAQYPTVKYASSLLAKNGFLVYALDLPGHGLSPGTRGLLTSVNDLITDGIAVANHAKVYSAATNDGDPMPLFLVGSSMGGSIALKVAERIDADLIQGVIMLAPMLSLKVSGTERMALSALSMFMPTAPLIPSLATTPDKQYRDPQRRAECEADEMSYKGKLRVSSALTCVDLASTISESFGKITVPFLCMLAEEDVVVDNTKVDELLERANSEDKTLKRYKALHGLLCEPEPLRSVIEGDFVQWIVHRCRLDLKALD